MSDRCAMCNRLLAWHEGDCIDGRRYCHSCVKAKKRIDAGKPAVFEDTEEIMCPYCGYRDEDSYEYGDDECFEVECPDCGRTFDVTQTVIISYDSRPKEATEE